MDFDQEQALVLLASFPSSLDGLLRHLPDVWLTQSEGAELWSPIEIVEHLIHAERVDWLPRARMILDHGESRTFEPFDRQAESTAQPIGDLLDEFARLRARNLNELRDMELLPEDFERRGSHPAFGVVSLSQLLATWAVHDMTHLHQLSRTLAHQYRDAVGPWSAYLGVLKCQGHSS